MRFIRRLMDLFRRGLAFWRHKGFIAFIKKFRTKFMHKLGFISIEEVVNRPAESLAGNDGQNHYWNIYKDYLSFGQNDKRPEYVELSDIDLSGKELPVKLIAFYLPQFHPVPENDLWWGRGFTEWKNVSKAVPQFVGHYQPHLPGELGFYDLRVPDVQRRQVELAKKFGLSGFCFYYYWFNGKRLLEKPLDQFLSIAGLDFPFCLCWANENWTRRWDGLDNEVLLAQDHTTESLTDFIKDLEKYMRNERYIRIEGRPLLIVYKLQRLPDPKKTVEIWRHYCLEQGIGDPYLVAVQTEGVYDPRPLGFDAVVEFPPHGIPPIPQIQGNLDIVNPNFQGMVFDYLHVAEIMLKKLPAEYTFFRTVMPSWDNSARRQNQPLIFHNSNPLVYESWLASTIEYSLENNSSEAKLVFINAWNEWAEGTHLEPDLKFGYAYLQSTANALCKVIARNSKKVQLEPKIEPLIKFEKKHSTAVILHIYYPELWSEIISYLSNLDDDFDLFVSVSQDDNETLISMILERYPLAYIHRCNNRGRDIAPFLQLYSEVNKLHYKYLCKIHTKRSVQREDGSNWRSEILLELLGSSAKVKYIKQCLDQSDIGIVGPRNNLISTEYFMGGNDKTVMELARNLDLLYWGEPFNFVAGSMFWFKPSALSPILRLALNEDDFPPELGQNDATLAHAIERLICLVAHKSGYKVIQTGSFDENPILEFKYAVPFLKR
jgi:lipopolysaccharide biosynthesis protein